MSEQTYKTLVKEIAENSPLYPEGWTNVCSYCKCAWAENIFEAWKQNEADKKEFEHHDEDCLWVRANKLIREN